MTRLSRACGEWGARLARSPRIAATSIAAGLVLAAALCAGIYRARLATSVSEQWVLQGSRLSRDRQTYERMFGGLSRDLNLVISSAVTADKLARDAPESDETTDASTDTGTASALSVAAFRALLGASEVLLSNTSSISAPIPDSSPVGTVRAADICTRQAVPVVFGPTSGSGFGIDRTVLSWGYAFLSICLADAKLLPDGIDPLPQSWGITSFPCQRSSALDCFRDGGFDYPPELRAIDDTGLARALANSALENSTGHRNCVDQLRVIYTPLTKIAYPQDPARGDSEALLLANAVDQFVIPTFATWGYAYRPWIADFTGDDDALRRYVTAGISNLRNPNITAEQCATTGIPCCRQWNGLAVDSALAIGGTIFSASGDNATDAVAIRTALSVDNQNSPALAARLPPDSTANKDEDSRLELLLDYEKAFITHYEPMHRRTSGSGYDSGETFDGLHLDLYATRSSDDILRDGNQAPARLIAIGYSLMLLYTVLVMANYSRPFGAHNFVLSRVGLGIAGILVLSLGTASGFGFVSWLKVPLSPTTTNVLPFIACVGIDDLFVIMQALISTVPGQSASEQVASGEEGARQMGSETRDESGDANDHDIRARVEVRMRRTVSLVGPSIVLTSLSLFIGFLVASTVRIPAVYTFTYQLAATILINLVFLFLLFMPICALDSYRVASQRLDLFPCVKSGDSRAETQVKGGTVGASVSRFARETLGPKFLFRSPFVTSSIVILALLFTVGMAILAVLKSKPGLPLNTIALRGTYQRSFLDVQESSFPVFGSFLVHASRGGAPEGLMASKDVQQGMVIHADAVQAARGTSSTPAIHQISWLHNSSTSFLGTYNELGGVRQLSSPIPTEDAYREAFGTFASTNGASYLSEIFCELRGKEGSVTACDLQGGYPGEIVRDVEVKGSRMSFLQSGLSDTETIVAAIESSRLAIDSAEVSSLMGDEVESFVYGAVYEFYEQYVSIYKSLAKVVGFALLGVSAVVFALLRSARLTIAIVLIMLLIIVQTFGLCTALGIQLNAVSVTSYVIAIAMSVEFTAHYAHAYAEFDVADVVERDPSHEGEGRGEKSKERCLRAQWALTRMLAPNLNGFGSTAVSLVALYGSRFPFVRLYYALSWMLLVFVAFLNGIVVLPCLLWLFGPTRPRVRSQNSESG